MFRWRSPPTTPANEVSDTKTPSKQEDAPSSSRPPSEHRLSLGAFSWIYGKDGLPPTAKEKSLQPQHTTTDKEPKRKLTRSEKHAEKAALQVRSLIVGPGASSATNSKARKGRVAPPTTTLAKVKSNLLKPKTANKVIIQLRKLRVPQGPVLDSAIEGGEVAPVTLRHEGPIHAVCLPCTDTEADETYFSKLSSLSGGVNGVAPHIGRLAGSASVASADLTSLVTTLRDINVVNLLGGPDLGFGQPSGNGPLSGSVPSPKAVMNGFNQITTQLLNLGFTTSSAVLHDHSGVSAPTDRMSVFTYWWGLEIALPPPSLQYLASAHSISNSFLNFLSAVSLVNNGVREILPFVRYISQFMEWEFNAIKAQDKGKGVVCAATWLMPAAMVPRPWDFLPLVPPKDPDDSPGSPNELSFQRQPVVIHSSSQPGTIPDVMVTPATLPRSSPLAADVR